MDNSPKSRLTSGRLRPPGKFFNAEFSRHTPSGTTPGTKESDDNASRDYSKGLAEKLFKSNVNSEYSMTEESKGSPIPINEQVKTPIH